MSRHGCRRSALSNGMVAVLAMLVLPGLGLCVEHDALPELEIEYEQFELDNGLTTLVYTDSSSPTVLISITYKVGSKNEPEGKTGFAHLFEHLMFQGSENYDDEYFEGMQSAGVGAINGWTSSDRTQYYEVVPVGGLDRALWLESDRMSNFLGALSQAKLDEQRSVVKNEKRQRYSAPYGDLRERLNRGLFPKAHPYHHPVIGSMEDLDNASLDDARAWFRANYGASNAVLLLAGDIDVETAKEKVARYFGSAPVGEPIQEVQEWVPRLNSNRVEIVNDHVPQQRILRSWPLPPMTDKTTVLMALVASTLANNDNSPMRQRLVEQRKLATQVSAYTGDGLVASKFTLDVQLAAGADRDATIRIVEEELLRYFESGPNAELLRAAKSADEIALLRTLESPRSTGGLLAHGMHTANDPLFALNSVRVWKQQAQRSDLAAVAREWLSQPYLEVDYRPFEYAAGDAVDADRNSLPLVDIQPVDVAFPEIHSHTLENGLNLIYMQTGSVPLMRVVAIIDRGRYHADDRQSGVADLTAFLLDKGTERYSADELTASWNEMGVAASFFADELETFGRVTVRTGDFGNALELLGDQLRHSNFPEDALDTEKVQARVWIEGRRKDPSRSSRSYLDRALHGKDGGQDQLVTLESLEATTRSDIVSFHQRYYQPRRTTLFVSGNLEFAEVRRQVHDTFGRWHNTGQDVELPAPSEVGLPGHARVIMIDRPDAEQTAISVGQVTRGMPVTSDRTVDLFNQILGGGFTSRINSNLREDKGWTYGAYSGVSRSKYGDTTIVARGKFQADKTRESMQELMKELKDISGSRPVDDAEFEKIRDHLASRKVATMGSTADFLQQAIFAYQTGRPLDHEATEVARTLAVAVHDVNRIAGKLVDPDKLTWVVIGDLREIEDDVRSLGYGEVEIWDADGKRLR